MSKALLTRFLARAVRQGRLGVVYADGTTSTFGTPAPGFPEIVLRLADDKVPRDILLDPRLGAAEAFMDGRLLIEEGDVMGLVSLLRANNAWDKGGDLRTPYWDWTPRADATEFWQYWNGTAPTHHPPAAAGGAVRHQRIHGALRADPAAFPPCRGQ